MSKTLTTTVKSFEQLSNRVDGTPRFKIHTNAGSFVTSANYPFTHGVTDGLVRCTAGPCISGRSVELSLTGWGRVSDLVWAV